MSVKIRVKKPSNKLFLDIHYFDIALQEHVRHKEYLGLSDTASNWKMIEKEIIPHIEREISLGNYSPKSKRCVVKKLVKEYGLLSFERHSNDRREHVRNAYEKHFMNHIVPSFGNRAIENISPMELIEWQNIKQKEYKASTVRKFRSIFYSIFTDAVLENIIKENPFDKVPRPSDVGEFDIDDEDDESIRPFSLDEIYELMEKAKGYLKNFIAIMSFSSMRPGELVSLKWNDVNFEDSLISIRRTTVYGEIGPVKTASSKRVIEMLPIVKEYLLKQKDLTYGNPYDTVFLNSYHKPFYSHDIIAVHFKKLLDENDTRYLYQLRHSFASMMISQGEDVLWVSRMMGHKSLDITLSTYSKAYSIWQDKKGQKRRATFLEKRP
jgi:integrase